MLTGATLIPFPSSHATGFGAAYGTAKAGVGIASMGVLRPDLVIKSIIPVVMAGVLGIYGLIIAVIISTGSKCFPMEARRRSRRCSMLRSSGQHASVLVLNSLPLDPNPCSQPDR